MTRNCKVQKLQILSKKLHRSFAFVPQKELGEYQRCLHLLKVMAVAFTAFVDERILGGILICSFQIPGCLTFYYPQCVGLSHLKSRDDGVRYSNCEDGESYMCNYM